MTYEISEKQLALLFPAFLEVDSNLILRDIGPAIRRRCQLVATGDPLGAHFTRIGFPADPELPLAAERGDPVLLRSRASGMELNGIAIPLDDGYLLTLNIIPAADSLEQTDLQISDFGPGDPAVPALLLVTLQKAMIEEARTNAIELTKERQRSLDLLERVSRVAGYLAHDFNNFLSIIRLNGDRLLGGTELTEMQKRLVGIMLETSERGSEITRSLLTLSHQKSDSRSRIQLDRLVRDHHAFFSTVAGSAITVSCRLHAEGAVIEAPRTGLLNCLTNLVINARDAMPEGGEITISSDVRTVELPPSGQEPASPRAYVAIAIADTGHGMSEEVLERAFEPFFSTKQRGSGIGLASVMDFAQEMGGSACLESREGEGATIFLYLPLSAIEGADARQEAPVATPAQSGMGVQILVVEDEPYALEALKEMLEGDGYQVSAASSAAEAMVLLAQQTHQVLLTDVVMPETSGLDLAAWASERFPGIHIVMMSGYVPENRELRDGWRFIRKPLDIALLREMLHAALLEDLPDAG